MDGVIDMLRGGDRRSIGRVADVVELIARDPSLFPELVMGLDADDAVIRLRVTDAMEKLTRDHPEWLAPYSERLLGATGSDLKEVRWHLAQMLPRIALTPEKKKRVVDVLMDYLSDSSSIVKTFAMQSLADLSRGDAALRRRIIRLIEGLVQTGTPAMKSRGRKLLQKLRR
jgi:hypothetical protein